MGFFNRLCGGSAKSAVTNPEPAEPVPEFPYELIRVRGAEAVAQAPAWREEWRGQFTPEFVGRGLLEAWILR